MKILLTGAGGCLGTEITRELESMKHQVYALNRSDLDFNFSSTFDSGKYNYDGLIICHGEYFDKLLDPQIALENFKNTREFVINIINNNKIKFVSFILSDCNFEAKNNYEWYSYNKILLEKLSKFLISKNIITHNYHPTRMNTRFHTKHSTANENSGLSLQYLSKLVSLDVELMRSTRWRVL